MLIQVNRLWQAPDNSEFRSTMTGILKIDGQQCAFTLEPTSLRIPAGTYPIKLAMSHRFQRMTPHILNVPERTEIEIHGGNTSVDSEGCILVAEHRLDSYRIYESKPSTDLIEEALSLAEANHETNTIKVTEEVSSGAD